MSKLILPPSEQPSGSFCALLGSMSITQNGNTVSTALTPCLEALCKFYLKHTDDKEPCLLKLFFLKQLSLPDNTKPKIVN